MKNQMMTQTDKRFMVRSFRALCLFLLIVSMIQNIGFSTDKDFIASQSLLNALHWIPDTYQAQSLSQNLTKLEGYYYMIQLQFNEEDFAQTDSFFTDIPNWASTSIQTAYLHHMLLGESSNTFNPNHPLDWETFVSLLLTVYADKKNDHANVGTAPLLVASKEQAIIQAIKLGVLPEEMHFISKTSPLTRGYALDIVCYFLKSYVNPSLKLIDYQSVEEQLAYAQRIQQSAWMPYNPITDADSKQFKQALSQIYSETAKQFSLDYSKVGISVEELHTGLKWSVGDDLKKDSTTGRMLGKFSIASAVKFPLAMAMIEHLENQSLSLQNTFKDPLTGKSYTFENAIRFMLSHSRTDYYNILLRYIGVSSANAHLNSLGVEHSAIKGELGGGDAIWSTERMLSVYKTTVPSRFTPSDLSILLRYVYKGVVTNDPMMTLINQALLNNIYHSRLPKGIGYQYPVAHKTGTYEEEGRFVDAGIIYLDNHPYSVVILLDGQENTKDCEPFMRALSKNILTYMKKRINS